jgi:multidrug efflux system membrane fusion protein
MATSEVLNTGQRTAPVEPRRDRDVPPKGRGWVWFVVILVIAGGIFGYIWQSRSRTAASSAAPAGRGRVRGAGGAGSAATPVLVSKVGQKTVPIEARAIGTVEAYSTVSIRSQIAGQLMETHFKEGDFVRKGQLLLTIDPRPYEAVLAQAKAELARDKAVAVNNRAQASRYLQLLAAGVVPAQQTESFTSAADASDATVSADEAAVQTAQINVEYCNIFSPIDGRTGSLMVKPGNLVKAADVPILVINQLNPIFVDFTLPQQYLPDVKKYMAAGSLTVTATLPNDASASEQGTLTFVDNSVDVTTGTIPLRATFANTQNRLWPGLYVNVVLRLSQENDAVVVPTAAIMQSQNGPVVYVVKADRTAEARTVVTNRTVEDETVIVAGLKPGETIVTDGQALLIDGSNVQIKNDSGAAEPAVAGSSNRRNPAGDQSHAPPGSDNATTSPRTTP